MTAGLETFAKVRALHDRTDNPSEKAAAASRMEALARAAGMTVKQAASKLDRKPKASPKPQPKTQAQAAADAFNEFFNSPEMRARSAEQARKKQIRRAEILARYGSIEAVYAETEREAALREACKPFTVWDRRPDYEGNYTLDGWDWHHGRQKVPGEVREAVTRGWPLPQTVKAVWAEYIDADERDRDRQTMHDYEHIPDLWLEVRRHVLEELLDTLPAASIGDMLARQSWMEHWSEIGSRNGEDEAKLLATLRADIERMGARLREQDAEPVQSGHDPDLDGRLKSQPVSLVQSGRPEGSAPDAYL